MEQLLQSNLTLLYIVLLMSVVIMGVKITERMRIALIYGFSLCLILAGSISYKVVAIGSTIVLIVALEFISSDRMRSLIFTGVFAKTKDLLYRLFIELAYPYFVLSLFCLRIADTATQLPKYATLVLTAISIAAMVRAFLLLSSPRYKTADISDIIDKLTSKAPIYQAHTTPHIRELFNILSMIEDRTYFIRPATQHTIANQNTFRKILSYMREHHWRESFYMVIQAFNRGYGTIEMQLLRSIGIELGYSSTLRRKLFELCYSDIIFNGYRDYLARGGGGYSNQQYREFIIRQYIENVGVKLNDKVYIADKQSTVLQVFDKKDLEHITKEEFYVWCLGLPRYEAIGPIAVQMHFDVLLAFAINQHQVMRIVNKL